MKLEVGQVWLTYSQGQLIQRETITEIDKDDVFYKADGSSSIVSFPKRQYLFLISVGNMVLDKSKIVQKDLEELLK